MSPPTGRLVEPLATYAGSAGRILSDYAAVDRDLFGALSLVRYFQRVDFSVPASRLKSLQRELEGVAHQVEQFESNHPAADVSAAFLSVFRSYLPALLRSVSLLTTVCVRLAEKSSATHPYSWSEYRSDMRQYRESVAAYVRLGGHLNEALAQSRA